MIRTHYCANYGQFDWVVERLKPIFEANVTLYKFANVIMFQKTVLSHNSKTKTLGTFEP